MLGDWALLDKPRLQDFVSCFPHTALLATLHFDASTSSAVIRHLCATGALSLCAPSFLARIAATFAPTTPAGSDDCVVESSLVVLLAECVVCAAQQARGGGASATAGTTGQAGDLKRAPAAFAGALTREFLSRGVGGERGEGAEEEADARVVRVLCSAVRKARERLQESDVDAQVFSRSQQYGSLQRESSSALYLIQPQIEPAYRGKRAACAASAMSASSRGLSWRILSYLTQSVFKVVSQKSIPPQIRTLILYISNSKG